MRDGIDAGNDGYLLFGKFDKEIIRIEPLLYLTLHTDRRITPCLPNFSIFTLRDSLPHICLRFEELLIPAASTFVSASFNECHL